MVPVAGLPIIRICRNPQINWRDCQWSRWEDGGVTSSTGTTTGTLHSGRHQARSRLRLAGAILAAALSCALLLWNVLSEPTTWWRWYAPVPFVYLAVFHSIRWWRGR